MVNKVNSLAVLVTLLFTAASQSTTKLPINSECMVQFTTGALPSSDLQKLEKGLGCDHASCILKDCIPSSAECCDGEHWLRLGNGLRKEGCSYTCTTSTSSTVGFTPMPLGYTAVVTVTKSKETDEGKCTDLDLTWDSTGRVDVHLCASASMCDSSIQDARSVVTFVYSWDCQACRTNPTELAPVIFDRCCDKCNEIIRDQELNQATNSNFLICNGCDSQTSALRHLKGYIENDSAETEKIQLVDYVYKGKIGLTTENGGDPEDLLQMECTASMGEVESKFDIKQIKCDRCSAEAQKQDCCDLCENTDDGDTNYVCDGCDGFESKIDQLIEQLHEDICTKFSGTTEDGNKTKCESMSSGAGSLTFLVVLSGLALSLL